MIPPVGSIIIGPCPQCKELVVVFCGQVLPLDRHVMEGGDLGDRQEHLLSVLSEFLRDRVCALMTEAEEGGESLISDSAADLMPTEDDFTLDEEEDGEEIPVLQSNGISETEFERFIEVDLKLLDNMAYFRSVFDH